MRIKLFEAWMRPISQFDMNGNHIEDFECISDAARKTGIENTAISSVVNGRRKSTGGYVFKEREWNQKEISNFIDFVKENDPDLLDDLKKYEDLNFKEFFKSNKQKVKEKFLNLFEIDASDIDEILWDIKDEMEAINFKYELITPSSTLPVLIKDSKFKIDGDRWEYYPLNTIFSDAYRVRTTDKYLFNFTISFVLNCYKKDLKENIHKIEDVCERISDIIQFDGGASITNRGTIDEFTIGHHIVYMNFFLFK